MTSEWISAFLVVVLKWLELDDDAKPILLEKMECFAECLIYSPHQAYEHIVPHGALGHRLDYDPEDPVCAERAGLGEHLKYLLQVHWRDSQTTERLQFISRIG